MNIFKWFKRGGYVPQLEVPSPVMTPEPISELAKNIAKLFDEDKNYYAEILRRLNEADALRKENEELSNLLGECPKRNNRLGRYSDAKPVQIDVCKLICMAKESEASHE